MSFNPARLFYYSVAALIAFGPLAPLVYPAPAITNVLPGWAMFTDAHPVCTLRFHGPAGVEDAGPHDQVLALVRNERWLRPKGRGGLVFDGEPAVNAFLVWLCSTGKMRDRVFYQLDCFENGAWKNDVGSKELACH